MNLTGSADPRRIRVVQVARGYFSTLGIDAMVGREPVTEKIIVTPDYFAAIGMRLLRDRWFTGQDGTKGHARRHHQRSHGIMELAEGL
jgi:hypothetical protein